MMKSDGPFSLPHRTAENEDGARKKKSVDTGRNKE